MQARHEHQGLTWVDLESPTREEVRALMEEFNVEPLIAEELLTQSSKPRAEFRKGYVYLIMHFPALRHSHKNKEQEVDFVIGKKFLITTHYEAIDPIHNFTKIFEVTSALDEPSIGDQAAFIFFGMLKRLYKGVEHELEVTRRDLSTIEEHIFSGDEILMVEAISQVSRDLLNLRQIIEPHREVLHSLENDGVQFFGEEFMQYLRALTNEYYKVHNHIMRLTESLHELRETNNSLLSTKQNETLKLFTIMAFSTFPLTLIATIFAMHAGGTPLVTHPYGFWIIVGAMALSGLAMLAFFKKKNWI